MEELGNAEKADGVVEGAPGTRAESGFFGRLANKDGVPEGGGVVEVALKSEPQISILFDYDR